MEKGKEMDPNNKTNNKSWKKEGIYPTFTEADSMRYALLSANTDGKLLIKIRRCGPGGDRFKVISYYPPAVKKNKGKEK